MECDTDDDEESSRRHRFKEKELFNMEIIEDIIHREILHWNYRNLIEIPKEVINYGSHLKEIYLKRNQIIKLPREIFKLGNLSNIYLIGNQLESLPEEIGQLVNLRVLDLSQNYLSKLPESIGDLAQLQQFILTHNQIESLPQQLRKLKKLIYLELSGNLLRRLGENLINGLVSLEELCLDQNPIEYIPREVSQLAKLHYISACGGNLKFLPHFFQKSCDFSSSQLLIHFDRNPKLNYVPSWLLGRDFDSYGCGESRVENDGRKSRDEISFKKIELFFKGVPHRLHFDEDLSQISRPTHKKPQTLFELSLRYIYKKSSLNINNNETLDLFDFNDESHLLPPHLLRLLSIGPISTCFHCSEPIFTELTPLVFSLPPQNNNLVEDINGNENEILRQSHIKFSVLFFCSSDCYSKLKEHYKELINSESEVEMYYKKCFENELEWFSL